MLRDPLRKNKLFFLPFPYLLLAFHFTMIKWKEYCISSGVRKVFAVIDVFYELAENTRDFTHEMNRLRTKRVF
ncbi:hypothetical protein C2W64_04242 [Brevibacillus laterosporus]|nr:hypothetical protein C2W64_04242 [Brevibacillus laterosporus]